MTDPALAAMAAAVAALPPEPRGLMLSLLKRVAENPPPPSLIGLERLAWGLAIFPPEAVPAITAAIEKTFEATASAAGYDQATARVAAAVSTSTIVERAAAYRAAMAGADTKH